MHLNLTQRRSNSALSENDEETSSRFSEASFGILWFIFILSGICLFYAQCLFFFDYVFHTFPCDPDVQIPNHLNVTRLSNDTFLLWNETFSRNVSIEAFSDAVYDDADTCVDTKKAEDWMLFFIVWVIPVTLLG